MGSSLHYFSYCYPLPVIDTFSGIMSAQQILLVACSSAAIIHSPDLKAFLIFRLNYNIGLADINKYKWVRGFFR